MNDEEPGRPRPGQLLTGVTWVVLLLGLWLWGRDLSGGGAAAQLATTGDVAAVGRPWGRPAPPQAHAPVPAPTTVRPRRITLGAGGVRGAGIVERDPGRDGALAPPTAADVVGWYADGPQPGEAGAVLLVGRADANAGAAPAVFRSLTGIRPGERVEIRRSDGSTVRFAVEDVRLFDRRHFDVHRARAVRARGRAELRLIGSGVRPAGRGSRGGHGEAAVVVVSGYLTGYQPPAGGRD
ncbi:sortase domain-containing protein [Streptomyces lydicus]|uniref:sortase domain-containing protein n=1 Tax=Streptomyces lydicus TaxID=47763 RepID=UPI0037B36E9B